MMDQPYTVNTTIPSCDVALSPLPASVTIGIVEERYIAGDISQLRWRCDRQIDGSRTGDRRHVPSAEPDAHFVEQLRHCSGCHGHRRHCIETDHAQTITGDDRSGQVASPDVRAPARALPRPWRRPAPRARRPRARLLQCHPAAQGVDVRSRDPGRAAAFVRRGGGVLHEGAPRLTVPEHPRLLPRFLQSLRCPLVGQASLARRRRVQLLSGQVRTAEQKQTTDRRSASPEGGGKPDRSSGPPSIPMVFRGTQEGCIEWSSMLRYGAASMWKG